MDEDGWPTRLVMLMEGGEIELIVRANPLALCASDRDFVESILELIDDYEEKKQLSSPVST